MTNDRPAYILPLVNINIYWPIIGHLYCMMSFLLQTICCFAINNAATHQSVATAIAIQNFLLWNQVKYKQTYCALVYFINKDVYVYKCCNKFWLALCTDIFFAHPL